MNRLLLILLAGLALSSVAQAASFDCDKAATKVEKLICSDATLSKLDDELAAAYRSALQNKIQADSLRQAQKQWVKNRNGCTAVNCIAFAYEHRIKSLWFIANTTASSRDLSDKSAIRTTHTEENGGNNSWAHYILVMSKDDSVCKPILAEYNRNISLDLWPKSRPYPYPWPAPSGLALTWKMQSWKALAEDERVLETTYTVTEADLDGDGTNEMVVKWASWVRSDDRFTSLGILSRGVVLPDKMKAYKQFIRQDSLAEIIPGGYDLPKLNGLATPTVLNDFDVIQFNGKNYVTGKTVDMDGVVEMHDEPQWRVISRVRFGEPARSPKGGLDRVLDSVCYFKLKITRNPEKKNDHNI